MSDKPKDQSGSGSTQGAPKTAEGKVPPESASPAPGPTAAGETPPAKEHTQADGTDYDFPDHDALEEMDRAELVAKLDDLEIVFAADAPDDALRATLRRAPELVAERDRLRAAEAGEE